jgi:hypothetical protein
MQEAGLFLVFDNACQEGDVDLACRLLMRMVEQVARAPVVDMTRLCQCPLRPKQSTAQQGVPWFYAECRILRACYRHSRLRGTPRDRACLQAQYHRLLRAKRTAFYRCKARLLLAKVRANRGLAVKGLSPRAQHTHAPVTPQAWAHFIQVHFRGGQAARVQYDPQTSVIAGGRATCFTMPSLPVVTAAVWHAIQRTRDTSATGDDGIGPVFIKHAVLGGTAHTPDHVLAPLLGRLFCAVLC